jgi:hypothetical protein
MRDMKLLHLSSMHLSHDASGIRLLGLGSFYGSFMKVGPFLRRDLLGEARCCAVQQRSLG